MHEPAHIRAALDAAAALGHDELIVSSAPGAAGYAGPQWFKNVIDDAAKDHPDIGLYAILDCGDRPGDALTALRLGVTDISLTGKASNKVAAIAKKLKARLHKPAHGASLDLIGVGDPQSNCETWLRKRL